MTLRTTKIMVETISKRTHTQTGNQILDTRTEAPARTSTIRTAVTTALSATGLGHLMIRPHGPQTMPGAAATPSIHSSGAIGAPARERTSAETSAKIAVWQPRSTAAADSSRPAGAKRGELSCSSLYPLLCAGMTTDINQLSSLLISSFPQLHQSYVFSLIFH